MLVEVTVDQTDGIGWAAGTEIGIWACWCVNVIWEVNFRSVGYTQSIYKTVVEVGVYDTRGHDEVLLSSQEMYVA